MPWPRAAQPTFERAESELIKPFRHTLDLGAFSIELVHQRAQERVRYDGQWAVGRWAYDKAFADKSIDDLRLQASCVKARYGVVADLVGGTRGPPLAPDTFDVCIREKIFTNGADSATVRQLYRTTATRILGSTPALEFAGLSWREDDWAHLVAALRLCTRLRVLRLVRVSGTGAALGGADLPRSLSLFSIQHCSQLSTLPASLSRCDELHTLLVGNCPALTALPGLEGCVRLRKVDLHDSTGLVSLPDSLGSLPDLRTLDIEDCTSLRSLPELPGSLVRLELNGCSLLRTLPPLDGLAKLTKLSLRDCPTLAPCDLSKLSAHVKVDGLTAAQRPQWGLQRERGGGLVKERVKVAPRTKRADAGTLAAKAAAKVARDRAADAGKLPQEYEAVASGKGSGGAGHGLARFLRVHSFNEWPGPRPTQASARGAPRSGRASDNARSSPQQAGSVSLTASL